MAASDEDLIVRIAQRDKDAFLEFYDGYAPRVLGLLRKILGDATEAEDVLQDVMWEVWQKAANYDRRLGSPATWVLMMARTRAIDRVRKEARHRARLATLQEQVRTGTHEELNPSDVRDGGMREALAALPAERRTLIGLAFFSGLTRDQIAQATGVPVGTVKTRIRAGLQELRTLLAESSVAAT